MRHEWLAFPRYTRVSLLLFRDIAPANATIELRCKGRGCPKARKTRLRGGRRTVDFTSALRRRRLWVGARIDVRITAPGATGKLIRF